MELTIDGQVTIKDKFYAKGAWSWTCIGLICMVTGSVISRMPLFSICWSKPQIYWIIYKAELQANVFWKCNILLKLLTHIVMNWVATFPHTKQYYSHSPLVLQASVVEVEVAWSSLERASILGEVPQPLQSANKRGKINTSAGSSFALILNFVE